MTGRVTRGEDHFHRAIHKKVIVVSRGSLQEMPANPRSIEIFPDIAATGKPVGCISILVLLALDDMERLRKAPRRPGMIQVKMRKQDVGNARRVETEAG